VNAFLGFGFGFSLDSGCNWFLQFWLCGNSLSERGGSLTALWEVVRSALLRFTGSLGGGGGGGDVVLVQSRQFLVPTNHLQKYPQLYSSSQYFFLDWRRLPGGCLLATSMVVVVG
jgi:hypothetical protein